MCVVSSCKSKLINVIEGSGGKLLSVHSAKFLRNRETKFVFKNRVSLNREKLDFKLTLRSHVIYN